ncbi:hypothetical protein CJP72_11215 [Citrobacter sp. NCU1]|nr:hypothetical protein [Citrobacter sp. NCU1]
MSHNIRCFFGNERYGQLWDIAYNLHYHTCHSMPCLTPQTLYPLDFELQQGSNVLPEKMQPERRRA